MSAILPPSERLWWKHPLDRLEAVWIAISFIWCMVMFFMMTLWHVYGKQNLATETYKTTPAKFAEQAQAAAAKWTVRTETEQQIPVVAPPEEGAGRRGVRGRQRESWHAGQHTGGTRLSHRGGDRRRPVCE